LFLDVFLAAARVGECGGELLLFVGESAGGGGRRHADLCGEVRGLGEVGLGGGDLSLENLRSRPVAGFVDVRGLCHEGHEDGDEEDRAEHAADGIEQQFETIAIVAEFSHGTEPKWMATSSPM